MTPPIAYVTQIGRDGSGHERCGAACVASVLLSAGWQSDPYGLMLEVAGRLWPVGAPTGSTSDELARVLEEYGFAAQRWVGWEEAGVALDAGQDVLCLCDNRLLAPRPYPPGDAWNALHWLRLVQLVDGDAMAYVYDPLTYLPQPDGSVYQGPTVVRVPTLRAAIQATPVPEAGLLVWRSDANG